MTVSPFEQMDTQRVLDCLGDGVYITDTDRMIVFWSESAERLTGWTRDDVKGKGCRDGFLCHTDKEGRSLCGKELCPLHRCMVTGERSVVPVIVYANTKSGRRIPMQVTVSPLRNEEGKIIGGVETFRDLSRLMRDLECSKAIQSHAMVRELPKDPRIQFNIHYQPHDVVGGDYYAIESLGDGRYAWMLADVMGHGVASALYTMHLRTIWDTYRDHHGEPGILAANINTRLHELASSDNYFATAIIGMMDLNNQTLRLATTGHHAALLCRSDGSIQEIGSSGLPLGLMEGVEFETCDVAIKSGDVVLAYTDGAIELCDKTGRELGEEGLVNILRQLKYPAPEVTMRKIEEALLVYSNNIRYEDDLTLLEMRVR